MRIQDPSLLLEKGTGCNHILGESKAGSGTPRHLLFRKILSILAAFCLCIGFTFTALVLWTSIGIHDLEVSHASGTCANPRIRREWRTLSSEEKIEYIRAVQCLRHVPSRLGLEQSLYDDFPWVHSRVGEYSHGAAAFLAWHRAFINTYEKALQDQCDYQGSMTYWDWTLDWQNLTSAPVWDNKLGFGGNGSGKGDAILGGYCVEQGPFAYLQVLFLDERAQAHCLARGFETGSRLLDLGKGVHSDVVQSLMAEDDYEIFNLALEDGSHLAIPRSIKGDFSLFTAPYDPVFFLHHTQLDRLWWKWQHSDWDARMSQYKGLKAHGSKVRASPEDILPLGGLGEDFTASDVMDVRSARLCYIYQS